jgi:carbamoyl-phosphate synthase large subunit
MGKQKITVAVTGLNNTDNPGPGVPFIRGIKESQVFDARIIGLVYENLEPGIYMEGLCDRIFQIPYPSGGSDELIERVEHIHQQEKLDVLVPNFDAELFSFMKNEQHLLEKGIHTFLPTLKQFQEREKDKLPEYGKKYGVKVPGSINLGSFNQIKEIEENYDYPVMIKGQFYDAYVAANEEQVKQAFQKLAAKWGLAGDCPAVCKRYRSKCDCTGRWKRKHRCRRSDAQTIHHRQRKSVGRNYAGRRKMMELTRMIIQKTKWKGGMELELIKTNAGEYFLIEINPRIPAWVYLAVGAGQNIPEALVKLALGMGCKTNDFEYKIGKMFVRYSYDMIVDLEKFAAISIEQGNLKKCMNA